MLGEIIVGVLGPWASGKSTAARTLVSYLGGEDEVVFINDRALLASVTVNYIRELGDFRVRCTPTEDGGQRLEGERAVVYLRPGEDLESVDLSTVQFDLPSDPQASGATAFRDWVKPVRLELGRRLLDRPVEGKPIIIEAAFGTNTDPPGESFFTHTAADLFAALEEAGAAPWDVKWIIVEASYDVRSERNRRRVDSVSTTEFDRYAADGGDLEPDQQRRLEDRGTVIKRVLNDHGDVERFRADVIAAFEDMFGDVLTGRP